MPGQLRLDDGESGQLITPLTIETLNFIGAPDEGTLWPTFTSIGRFVIQNTDDLNTGLDKINTNALNRTGDTISGAITYQNGSSAVFANGATLTLQNGSTTTFQNGASILFQNAGAPFSVTSTTVVTNLNADRIDGLHSTSLGVSLGTSGNNTRLLGVGGDVLSTIVVPYATNCDTVDGHHASTTPTANYLVVADASGFLVTPSSAPTSNYQVANKKYVDDNSTPASLRPRAWGYISGIGGIRAGYNIASVTDVGDNQYVVAFTNSMSSANYATIASCNKTSTDGGDIPYSRYPRVFAQLTTSFKVKVTDDGTDGYSDTAWSFVVY